MVNLTNNYTNVHGRKYMFEYFENDSFDHLPQDECKQVMGFAFHKDKMILVNNVLRPDRFIPLGGSVEEGEKTDDAIIREIKEESNMKVLNFEPIGYQKVTCEDGADKPFYQLRYFCIVEPYGPFEGDPDGDVTEVLEIDPQDYKKYFDWGEIGDKIMAKVLKIKIK